MKNRITIRMGAAHWDARVNTANGPVTFNFRTMTKRERSDWHREFMNGIRQVYEPRATAA